ncbi:hypothetical protein ACWKW6_02470 [Dyadobacter jiangsuensis]
MHRILPLDNYDKAALASLCFLLLFQLVAQTPAIRINKVTSENCCFGTELSIDVMVEGHFLLIKNTLVAYRYWYDPARRWEYPAVLRGNKLVTTLKDGALADPESFQIKILSSNRKHYFLERI